MRWRDAEGGAPSTPSAAASLREGVASYRERARTRETEREDRKRRERERERGRALPGTLEVNVLRMVGRCLVCSRLISTWVSSLEPPPSTPSTVLHLHTHSHTHTHTIHQNRQSCSTTERIQRHRHQEACVLLHRSKFMSVSYVSPSRLLFPRSRIQPALEPYGDPFLPFSLLLGRRFTHGSLARPTREQPCSSPLNSRGLLPAHPACASSFHPFSRPRSPSSSPFHLLLAKNGNNSSRCARPFPRADPFHPVLFPRHPLSTIWIEIVENGRSASLFVRIPSSKRFEVSILRLKIVKTFA